MIFLLFTISLATANIKTLLLQPKNPEYYSHAINRFENWYKSKCLNKNIKLKPNEQKWIQYQKNSLQSWESPIHSKYKMDNILYSWSIEKENIFCQSIFVQNISQQKAHLSLLKKIISNRNISIKTGTIKAIEFYLRINQLVIFHQKKDQLWVSEYKNNNLHYSGKIDFYDTKIRHKKTLKFVPLIEKMISFSDKKSQWIFLKTSYPDGFNQTAEKLIIDTLKEFSFQTNGLKYVNEEKFTLYYP